MRKYDSVGMKTKYNISNSSKPVNVLVQTVDLDKVAGHSRTVKFLVRKKEFSNEKNL